jgi:ubiquitin carboxyl-terminal hydrolase 5/13
VANTATPTLYAWVCKYKVPKVPTADEQEGPVDPTKMAIGVEGGFKTDDQKYEDKTVVHLVASLNGTLATFQYPDPTGLPSFISDVVDSVVHHVASKVTVSEAAWVDEIKVSQYAASLPLDDTISNGTKQVVDISDPTQWACEESGLTEGLWLNLSDGYIGSGRKNWDGSGGTGAAKTHYEQVLASTGQKYPLVVKLGTITPDGKGDVYSYAGDEDDAVLDPQLGEWWGEWGFWCRLWLLWQGWLNLFFCCCC